METNLNFDNDQATEQISDLSIHFTIRDQPLEEIKKKLSDWSKLPFKTSCDLIIHHCFLPREIVIEKRFSTDVVDFLDSIKCNSQIRWFATGFSIERSRDLMFWNLYRLNRSAALFVGEIKEGVQLEYNLAKHVGLRIFKI